MRAISASRMVRKGVPCRNRRSETRMPDEEMLQRLRQLYERVVSLSHAIIDNAMGLPRSDLYRKRFGGDAKRLRDGRLRADGKTAPSHCDNNQAFSAERKHPLSQRRGSRDGHQRT